MKTKKITIYDIAERAKCSPATVSLALRNDERIKEETKQRIREIANKVNFQPNYFASNILNTRANTIGIITPDLTNPVFGEMINGAESYLWDKGYHVLTAVTNKNIDKEKRCVDLLLSQKVDGLILLPTYLNNIEEVLSKEKKSNLPIVVCGVRSESITSVYTDFNQGVLLAMKHLFEKRHTDIAFVDSHTTPLQSTERINAYFIAHEIYDIPINKDYIIHCSQNEFDIQNSIINFISQNNKVTAFFCLYDLTAYIVMKTLLKLKHKIPNDYAIVGYDNIIYNECLPISLTSIDTNNLEMGTKSASMILKKIENASETLENVVFNPSLVIREST